MNPPLWKPSPERAAASQMAAYQKWLPSAGEPDCESYDELWKFSVEDRETFWASIWDFCGVVGDLGDGVLENDAMPGADWFPGSRLNFAENLLQHRGPGEALVFVREDGLRQSLSRQELVAEVGKA